VFLSKLVRESERGLGEGVVVEMHGVDGVDLGVWCVMVLCDGGC